MSRTDIDAATFADYLRQMCGDGSVEWCYEPMQTSVLLDMADLLAENGKLQDENARLRSCLSDGADNARAIIGENAKLRELARLLLLGVDNDMPRDEELVWSQRVNALARKLGIEVDE